LTDRRAKLLCEALKLSLRTGKRPTLPAGGDLLWSWFLELHATRSYGPNGPNAISFVEIGAYLELLRIPAQPHHIQIVRAMDAAYMEHAFAGKGGATSGTSKQLSSDLSPDSFDAIFG
jgi:hypothetical protein